MRQQLVIETPSLTLREFVSGDTPKIFRMSQEEGMRTWIPSQVYRDEEHAAAVLALLISKYYSTLDPRINPLVLGVQLKTTGDLVGHVGLSPLGESVEVGYAIEHSQQRKGFATEAVSAMCTWGTVTCSLPTILGVTARQNIASQKVLLGAGFFRQREQVMPFQGLEQPVVIFEYSRQPAEPSARTKVLN
jgi:ribosomal-protein-alanine N-acetyltransferase